ncbi:MAG TPA: hypothetical protein VK819_08530, partial [Acidobacteriaceae bacterium]|nr:hypothetical protein [Acidobacteriaceae bacterium]
CEEFGYLGLSAFARGSTRVYTDRKDCGAAYLRRPFYVLAARRGPAAFYRMQIAAKDIPLADDLEVLIFSKSGDQLASVKGHL